MREATVCGVYREERIAHSRRENPSVRRESAYSRREKVAARRRERVRENFGAILMVLGFFLLLAVGDAENFTVIAVGGTVSVLLLAVGAWLGRAFYGQERGALWLEDEVDEDA